MISQSRIWLYIASLLRMVLGLKPAKGRKRYFAQRMLARCVEEYELLWRPARNRKTCPFCGYRAKTLMGLYEHMLARHHARLEELVVRCVGSRSPS